MSLYDLPPELLLEIAKCLHHKALARLSQTSRHLFIIATPALLDNSRSWVGRYGMTVLHWAAENGRTTLVERLLERKVIDIENTEVRTRTALHYSAVSGQIETTRTLLANGANPTAHDNYMCTPVGIGGLIRLQPPECRFCRTPLHYAASKGYDDIVRLLVESGADIGDCGDGEATPLQLATGHAHHNTARLLLELGADMKPAPNSFTPLHIALCSGYSKVFDVLLEKSVEADIKSVYLGSTLLHAAVMREERHFSIPALLARGADTNAYDNEGRTPLHMAVLWGFTEVVRCLLTHGADAAAQDLAGETPLHWAALNHCGEIVGLLLRQGADVDIKDQTGQTAADWVRVDYKGLDNLDRIISLLDGNAGD